MRKKEKWVQILFPIIISLWITIPVKAECYICDDYVYITEVRANCYLNNIHFIKAGLDQKTSAPKRERFIVIDFEACDSGQKNASLDKKRGIAVMPSLSSDNSSKPKTSYYLDNDGAECLHLLIQKKSPIDPAQHIDLFEECSE